MLRDHEEPHGHHVVILPLVVGAGSISKLKEFKIVKESQIEPKLLNC